MSEMHLTPDMLASAYDFLRHAACFRRLKLPDADELEFRVEAHGDRFGHFKDNKPFPVISVSVAHVQTADMLLRVIAHEMAHLRQHRTGRALDHGRYFKLLARRVCDDLGFDIRAF